MFTEKQHYFSSLYGRTCCKHRVKEELVQSAMEESYQNITKTVMTYCRMYKMSSVLNKTCLDLPSSINYS